MITHIISLLDSHIILLQLYTLLFNRILKAPVPLPFIIFLHIKTRVSLAIIPIITYVSRGFTDHYKHLYPHHIPYGEIKGYIDLEDLLASPIIEELDWLAIGKFRPVWNPPDHSQYITLNDYEISLHYLDWNAILNPCKLPNTYIKEFYKANPPSEQCVLWCQFSEYEAFFSHYTSFCFQIAEFGHDGWSQIRRCFAF